MRKCGVLMPIASLPGNYGIGTLGKSAYEFVDSLSSAGQSFWQILPLGPTSYGDSPYQSFSAFAGNPYFIDLDILIEEGLIRKSEADACDFGKDKQKIDYAKIYYARFNLLKKAYKRSNALDTKEYKKFEKDNDFWLPNYALYMAVKNTFNGVSYIEWDEPIRRHEADAVKSYAAKYSEEVKFYKFLQYMFFKQWMALKKYANEKGIKIIGDIPIYVAFDSADTWANPELFQFDEKGYPIAVAGCPPDAFSTTGQLWGNPLYDWKYHKETGYKWWIQRIKHCYEIYDVVRVDHFRAFDEYYSIPYGDKTAEFGKWKKGPGYSLFKTLKDSLGDIEMIAEDLGFLTPSVLKLVARTGYPGMKVLQFAFDSREDSDYLPHNYTCNSICYTGTHDNDTLLGWYKSIKKDDRQMAMEYLNRTEFSSDKDIVFSFIKLALSSVSKLCIIPMQDYLALDKEARINIPSTIGGNWDWRMKKGAFTKKLAKEMHGIAKLYARL